MEIKIIGRFNGKRTSLTSVEKAEAFYKDKHKLKFAKLEKHYKHTAYLIFNRFGECFLEVDNLDFATSLFSRIVTNPA